MAGLQVREDKLLLPVASAAYHSKSGFNGEEKNHWQANPSRGCDPYSAKIGTTTFQGGGFHLSILNYVQNFIRVAARLSALIQQND